jgi:hypothetical protein
MSSAQIESAVKLLLPVINFVGGAMFAYNSLMFINASIQRNIIMLDASMCARTPICSTEYKNLLNTADDAGRPLVGASHLATIGMGLACLRAGKK